MKLVIKPNKGPVHIQVAACIRQLIARDYKQGDLLPKHRELSASLGVGLRSITNAMRLLASQGIVTPVQKKGTVVARRPSYLEESLSRIALISRSGSGHLFAGYNGHILSGISSSLDALEVGLLLFPRKKSEYAPIEEVLAAGADGVIMLGAIDKDYITKYYKTHLPLVVLDNQPESVPVDSVVCDNFGATEALFDYLFANGHRKISYATFQYGATPDSDNRERREAFLMEMTSRGVEPCRPVCEMGQAESGLAGSSAAALVESIRTGENAPTVIVADSDSTAFSLLKIFRGAGIKVPEDVSMAVIAQVPDMRMDCVYPFTGCCMNFVEMGTHAVESLIDQCRRRKLQQSIVRVGYQLVDGGTVKKI